MGGLARQERDGGGGCLHTIGPSIRFLTFSFQLSFDATHAFLSKTFPLFF